MVLPSHNKRIKKMSKKNDRVFKTLDEREHVLTRPAMYLGSVVEVEKEQWIYNKEENKFKWETCKFVPALLKICDEIIDNSLDVAIDTNFSNIKNIKVTVSDTEITVVDDGPGIPVQEPHGGDPQGRTCPELAWTQMRSGTSFKENRKGPSANGVGSVCCNIFCKSFEGTSDDGKKRQTVKCANNMSEITSTKPSKSNGAHGVTVKMVPDLSRFGLESITDEHKALIYQRLLNLAICFPKLTFHYNGKKIAVDNRKFAKMFSSEAVVQGSDNATVIVFPNEYDEFKFYSYVNGLKCVRGGSQVDFIASEICSRVKEKLARKYKTLRPGDVKNRIGLVVFLTDFENAQFDAQTKESLANSNGDINRHLGGKIDFDVIAKQVLKCDAIINPIVETFKIKEELKARSEIKVSKRVKVKSDKYMASIGDRKYLALCEGLSAMSGVSSCLGRKGFGYYAMRGLPINGYSQSIQKISANQEFKDIMNVLGLDVTKNAKKSELNYEKILITTDADCYHPDTLILTSDGPKKIKDITYDDKVINGYGQAVDVVDIVKTNDTVIYKIVTDHGEIVVSSEQPIVVYDGRDAKFKSSVKPRELRLGKHYMITPDGLPVKITNIIVTDCFAGQDFYDITLKKSENNLPTESLFRIVLDDGSQVLGHNCDGSHITSMIIGWFKRFAPHLFEEGRVCKLVTPLVLIKDKKEKIVKYFLSLDEYKNWEANNELTKGHTLLYMKGLGSWERVDLQSLIDKEGIDRFIVKLTLDENSNKSIEDWLGDDSEPRKEYLRNFNLDINNV